MKIQYEAIFGAGYYFNLRPLIEKNKTVENTFIADILHETSAGWTIDKEVKTTIKPEHMKIGFKEVPRIASADEIFICNVGELSERFPESFIEVT